jgi:quercetin 2,3-dioxygenase
MLQLRKSSERGNANHGWLKSRHTFSFADYYDPSNMGFRSLRVINEDRIESGTGFGAHPHRDMEIISYVVKGSLTHEDSMGNKAIILPGEVQRMSAGSGVVHSEANANADGDTHFFQIWIQPNARGGQPGYGQKSFEADLNSKKLVLVVSSDAREGSIGIKQDADLYLSRPKAGDVIEFDVREGRGVWIQVVRGMIDVDGKALSAGDGLAFSPDSPKDSKLVIRSSDASEFMLFDLA